MYHWLTQDGKIYKLTALLISTWQSNITVITPLIDLSNRFKCNSFTVSWNNWIISIIDYKSWNSRFYYTPLYLTVWCCFVYAWEYNSTTSWFNLYIRSYDKFVLYCRTITQCNYLTIIHENSHIISKAYKYLGLLRFIFGNSQSIRAKKLSI